MSYFSFNQGVFSGHWPLTRTREELKQSTLEALFFIEGKLANNPAVYTYRSMEADPTVDQLNDGGGKNLIDCSSALRPGLVQTVARKRSDLLRGVALDQSLLSSCRFLLFSIDESVRDGGAQVASNGFFDASEEPGWDSWIDFHHDAATGTDWLLCSVPETAVEAVGRGIDIEPFGCLGWIANDCVFS